MQDMLFKERAMLQLCLVPSEERLQEFNLSQPFYDSVATGTALNKCMIVCSESTICMYS